MKREFQNRFLRNISFFEEELKDYVQFKSLTRQQYIRNRDKRRNVERWIENLINSTVDISKVILTAEEISIPDTYRSIVSKISTVEGLEEVEAEKLSKWVKFRNIIAHEYLDIKWSSINKFINETEMLYRNFLNILKQFHRKILESEEKEKKEV